MAQEKNALADRMQMRQDKRTQKNKLQRGPVALARLLQREAIGRAHMFLYVRQTGGLVAAKGRWLR